MTKNIKRKRLDELLVEAGLANDIVVAGSLILAGRVEVLGLDTSVVLNSGETFPLGTKIKLKTSPKYVSRGGVKLEFALEQFEIDVDGMVGLDIGSSTGGFTDCLLQHGAKHVYAVDVGRGQLHHNLMLDNRVTSMERTNARFAIKLPEKIDIITVDVSFISLFRVLIPNLTHLKWSRECILLVKPQFEARRAEVGVGGVIRDERILQGIMDRVFASFQDNGFKILGYSESPIQGQKGNREFLVHVNTTL